MSDHYPNQQEIEFALKHLQVHEQKLDVHERLILRNFRNMILNEQKEMTTHLLERAQHYNTTIIAVGYTAFFAAWAFFQNQHQNAWYDASLLIMLFSVLIFVLWNVLSNIIMSNALYRKVEIISRNKHNPLYLFEALNAFDEDLRERTMSRQIWWKVSLHLTVWPGIIASLMYFLIVGSGIINRLIQIR